MNICILVGHVLDSLMFADIFVWSNCEFIIAAYDEKLEKARLCEFILFHSIQVIRWIFHTKMKQHGNTR